MARRAQTARRAAFAGLAAATGLPQVIHDLRHAAASIALSSGVPISVVSKRLGHASITTTVDTYGHLLPDADRAAAEAVSTAIPHQAG